MYCFFISQAPAIKTNNLVFKEKGFDAVYTKYVF